MDKSTKTSVLEKFAQEAIQYKEHKMFLIGTAVKIIEQCREQGIFLNGIDAYSISGEGVVLELGNCLSFLYNWEDNYDSSIHWLLSEADKSCVYEIHISENVHKNMLSTVEYPETVDLLRRKREPSPLLREFSEWMNAKYGSNLVNYTFRKRADNKESLMLILMEDKDRQLLNKSNVSYETDPDILEQIKNMFISLSNKYPELHDPVNSDFAIFAWSIKESIRANIIRHCIRAINSCMFGMAGIEAVNADRYPIHIICKTEDDMKEYLETDAAEEVELAIRQILEPFDHMNVIDDDPLIKWSFINN